MPRTDDQGDSPVVGESLELVLAEARQLGFLGPGPLAQQVRHAKGFVMVARPLFVTTSTPRLVDMGAGGGLPGLVMAQQWPEASLVLLEANERRSAFLRRVVDRLEVADRVSILQERAEICGRDREWRATFDGAIARSFGRPAVLAECAAPLLKPGAWVVVSEPPTSTRVTTAQRESALGAGTSTHPGLGPPRPTGFGPAERSPAEADDAFPGPAEPGPAEPGPADPDRPSGTCWHRGGRAMAGGSPSAVRPRARAVASRRVRLPAFASGRDLSGTIPAPQWRAGQEAVVLIRRAEARLVSQPDTRGDPSASPGWSRSPSYRPATRSEVSSQRPASAW